MFLEQCIAQGDRSFLQVPGTLEVGPLQLGGEQKTRAHLSHGAMTKLSVNLNKFALLRNSRGKNLPNLVAMARRCIKTGVHGITVHPRPDQRHTKYQDVYDLAAVTAEHSVEFNIEGNPTPFFLDIVKKTKPTQCTLVPDAPQQLTSDHGWDLHQDRNRLQPIIAELQQAGIRASIFLDPDLSQVDRVPATGADRIELYTEAYADAFGGDSQGEVLHKYRRAALHAQQLGLGVNAGHDLNLKNLSLFLTIPGILEVSIGHAIAVDSLDYGLENCLNKYLNIVQTI